MCVYAYAHARACMSDSKFLDMKYILLLAEFSYMKINICKKVIFIQTYNDEICVYISSHFVAHYLEYTKRKNS